MTAPHLTSRRTLLGQAALVAAALGAGSAASQPRFSSAAPTTDDVEATLEAMPLAERVARLFVVPVAGTALTAPEASWLRMAKPGGVLLVGSNIGTPNEAAALIAEILTTNPALPPLIAVDQEGGLVSRLPGDPAPSAPELGLLAPAAIAAFARARAEFLARWGISANFAPVADIAWDGDSFMAGRAFGSDPNRVAEDVAAYVKGAAGTGVVHGAKHFPGHGRGSTDSHLALPRVDLSLAEWGQTDGVPFAAAVEAGVEMVMLGHLLYPEWDDLPTSLSPVAVEVLREELGFTGVVVTDDLGMAALSDFGPFETVDLAVAAGVDLLLYAMPPVEPGALLDHLVGQVRSGAVAPERIDESVRRVLMMGLG